MGQGVVLGIIQQTIQVMLIVAAPALIAGLVTGLLVSVFQVLTSVQDTALSFLPRIIAMLVAGYLAFPWMMKIITAYTIQLYQRMPGLVG